MAEEYESKKDKQRKAEEKAQGAKNPLAKNGRMVGLEDTAFKAPQFTRHPVSAMLKTGMKLRLAVMSTGVPQPKFRWRHNGVVIDGAASNVLIIPHARPSSSGNYVCEAYNLAGITTSRAAMINVTAKTDTEEVTAVVTVTPEKLSVIAGTEFAFLAQIAGTNDPSPRYQWYKDGKRVKGATSPMLKISRAKEKYVGSYTVVVDTTEGVVQSEPAVLELKKLPVPDVGAPALAALEPSVVSPAVTSLLRRRKALETLLASAQTLLAKPMAHVYSIDKGAEKRRKAA